MKKTFPMTAPLLTTEELNQNQDQDQSQNQDTSTQVVDNTTQDQGQGQQAPPTNTRGAATVVDPLYQEAYNEQYRKNQELEARLAAYERNQAQPARQVDDTNFFNEPATNMRTMIQEELSKALGTLPQDIKTQTRLTAYQQLKNQFRTHAHYPDFAEHEAGIDQIVNSGNIEPNIEGIKNAIMYLRGRKISSQYENPQPNTNTNANANTNTNVNNQNNNGGQIPAYTAPSAPPAPRNATNDIQAKVNALTEAERRVASQRGMSFEDFVRERDNPSNFLLSDPNPKAK